jgi:hypothetical protein
MRFSAVIVLLFCMVNTTLATNPIELRAFFDKAIYSESEAIRLCKNFENSTDVIEQGYLAATIITRAKFVINPYKKYAFFEQGRDQLEDLVKKYPEEVELRFIRYMIQTNIPAFLGYKNTLTSDKLFLVSQVSTVKDVDLKNRITVFLAARK